MATNRVSGIPGYNQDPGNAVFTLRKNTKNMGDLEPEFSRRNYYSIISPLKALAFNFRFNQLFGIFPTRISDDFMTFELIPRWIVWTISVKVMFASLIFALIYLGLAEQNFTFEDIFERAKANPSFSRTDYFSIISHFLFLQVSATVLFVNNLVLCKGLTRLCHILYDGNLIPVKPGEEDQAVPPSAKKLMTYRISVCVMCTMASTLLFSSMRTIVKNPETTWHDYVIIIVTVIALYVENQNHMFSELLFMRFCGVLEKRLTFLLDHIHKPHAPGDRSCCVLQADNVYSMYLAINETFGRDLLVAVFILVVSIVFGFYLLVTFAIFISCDNKSLFLATYFLYSFIPSLRLYVLSQSSERIRVRMETALNTLRDIEAEIPRETFDNMAKQVARSRIRYEGFVGFSADEFFHLNREFMTTLVGSLVTYLIVLLQFKQADMQQQQNLQMQSQH